MSEPQPIMTTEGRLQLGVLAASDVERVHEAALELLGPEADAAERALERAPRNVVLAGRVAAHDVTLDDGHCWLAAGSIMGPADWARADGGDLAAAALADLDEFCRLADALGEVAMVAGPPVRVDGLGRIAALARTLSATTKHVLAVDLVNAAEGEAAVRLAQAVAAGSGLPLSLLAGPAGREAVLAAARGGLATGLVLPPHGAADDLARRLVRHHAGVLAGCAAVQAATPGAPFLYVAAPQSAGVPPAGPEAALFQIAASQLAARAGLPVILGGLSTTSHEPDWQACTDNAFAALDGTAARAAVTAGAGTLGGGSAVSSRQLVMDTEIFSWTAMIARGVTVDDDTIALSTIKDVGVCGNYLSQRHTRRHMRDVWRPRLLDRSMWDAWVASGRAGAYEKAGELVARLLREHDVPPLPDEVRGTVARIVAEAGL